jgi:ATP-binding cassette subfamily G (WHITE) protein 2 (PDR)
VSFWHYASIATMTEPNSSNESASQQHTTSHESTSAFTQSSTTGHQTNTTTTSSNGHSTGIFRTSSGRETYYPDGHESRANGSGVGLFCEHDGHQETPEPLVTRSSYGLYPSQHSSTQHTSEHRGVSGAAIAPGHIAQSEQLQNNGRPLDREEEVALERVESSSSSSSSTRYGSNGEKAKRQPSSDLDQHGAALVRRQTRSEIDEDGRRELQRIFTTQSQKMGRQMSIAQPDDPTVDPGSESFDLSRFLRMFRKLCF